MCHRVLELTDTAVLIEGDPEARLNWAEVSPSSSQRPEPANDNAAEAE